MYGVPIKIRKKERILDMYTKENADQTIQKLGGYNVLKAMIGAKNFTYSTQESYVSFRFPTSNKINSVNIKLNPNDLYDIEFGRIVGTGYKVVKVVNDLYGDMLVDIFETETKLYLSL